MEQIAFVDVLDDLLVGTGEGLNKDSEDLEDFINNRHRSLGKVLQMKNPKSLKKTRQHDRQACKRLKSALNKNINVEFANRKAKIKIFLPPYLKAGFSLEKIVECAVGAINTELEIRERLDSAKAGAVSSQISAILDAAEIAG